MNHILKKLFLKLYNTLFRQHGRPNKKDLLHYFEIWCYLLRTGISWRNIIAPLHWSTYYKKFIKLTNIGFFHVFHTCALKIAQQTGTLDQQHLKTLFIDATLIKNVQGIDLLGKNHYDRNRQGNKLTLIISDNGLPLSIHLDTANQHDLTGVIPALDKITCRILHSRLVADKGYISKSLRSELRKKKIYLIHPYRKNQKQNPTTKERLLLNRRYRVENRFARFQQLRRLRLRWDKDSFVFIQWYYLGATILVTCQIDKDK